MKPILASSSPRRKQLFQWAGLQPEILIPEVEEQRREDETVEEFLKRIAIAKALSVYRRKYHLRPIVAADTVVLVDDVMIGKPKDRQGAQAMLQMLSGRCHEVWTGVALIFKGETSFAISRTCVHFKPLTAAEIEFYLDHEDYLDKAGAYAIQGRAALFVERIDGCFFNVMGFPLNLFYSMIRKMGVPLFS